MGQTHDASAPGERGKTMSTPGARTGWAAAAGSHKHGTALRHPPNRWLLNSPGLYTCKPVYQYISIYRSFEYIHGPVPLPLWLFCLMWSLKVSPNLTLATPGDVTADLDEAHASAAGTHHLAEEGRRLASAPAAWASGQAHAFSPPSP